MLVVYEFRCQVCGEEFDNLTFDPECPSCGFASRLEDTDFR